MSGAGGLHPTDKLEPRVLENKLLTMKGREFYGSRIKNRFLIGLIKSTKTGRGENVEEIHGQLLIISSNPIYVDEMDQQLQFNTINMSKLHLTKAQQATLRRASIYGGGRVSVYIANFFMNQCVTAGNCQLLNSNSLQVLRLLCGSNCSYHVEVDMEKVIPVTEAQLGEIIKVKMEEAFGQHDDIVYEAASSCCSSGKNSASCSVSGTRKIFGKTQSPEKRHGLLIAEERVGENEHFLLWKVDSELLLVEMIHPKGHLGYKVCVEFFEFLVTEPIAEDAFHGPERTDKLVSDTTNIRSTMTETWPATSGKVSENKLEETCKGSKEIVSEALTLFSIPDYKTSINQSMLYAWRATEIVNLCKVRLTCSVNSSTDELKPVTTEATVIVGHKKVLRRSNTFPLASARKIYAKFAGTPEVSPPFQLHVINTKPVTTETPAHSYRQCCFPVKLTLMKAVFSDDWKGKSGEKCDRRKDWKASDDGSDASDEFSESGEQDTHGKRRTSKKGKDCFGFWRF